MNKLNQSGFTLIELVVAMAIFSGALTLIALSFTGLVRTQRTIAGDRAVQQNIRRITEDIARDVRQSSGFQACITNGRSALYIDRSTPTLYYQAVKTSESVARLYRSEADPDNPCISTGTPQELTGSRVYVESMSVNITDGVVNAAEVDITLKADGVDTPTRVKTLASARGDSPAPADEAEDDGEGESEPD